MRRLVLFGSWIVLVVGTVVLAPDARAACHAFEVEVQPASPTEGAGVEVTVSRDAAVNPSSVRVRTVDGTATAGEDYEAVDRRVQYTADTEQTFTIGTLQDTADEPTETFRIVLSEGDGCQINPNFSYGEATVSIRDDDEPGSPTTAGPAPGAGATTTSTAARSTTTETTATEETSSTTSASDTTPTSAVTTTTFGTDEVAAADDDDDGGGSAAWLAVAAVVVVAAAAGIYLLVRSNFGRSG